MKYPDIMLDIETTGNAPDRHAVLQIAAVRFDLNNRAIDSADMFNACLLIPPWRSWDEETRVWWRQQNPAVLHKIFAAMRDPRMVMTEFVNWAFSDGLPDRFLWAKNAAFDASFIGSYCRDFEVPNPFHYRNVRDIRTFILGRAHPNGLPEVEEMRRDDAHDALIDCITQIDWLFKLYDNARTVEPASSVA